MNNQPQKCFQSPHLSTPFLKPTITCTTSSSITLTSHGYQPMTSSGIISDEGASTLWPPSPSNNSLKELYETESQMEMDRCWTTGVWINEKRAKTVPPPNYRKPVRLQNDASQIRTGVVFFIKGNRLEEISIVYTHVNKKVQPDTSMVHHVKPRQTQVSTI